MSEPWGRPDVWKSLYVDGAWVFSSGLETIDVENPATEQLIGRVPSGTPEDVDRAVRSARTALIGWSATPATERQALLCQLGDLVTERSEAFAQTISHEMGAPIAFARTVQAGLGINDIRAAADSAGAFEWERQIRNSMVVMAPLGVVGCITPWNYPLHQVTAKVAYALAAGCTVVLKPSEVTPLTAYLFLEAIHDVGFPPGVVNLVTGYGPSVGEAVASHPGVDMISFTGSTQAGRRVAALAAATVKKVALELGGKSANVILPDADIDAAVRAGVANCFRNAGQACNALTRMLVHEARYAEALEIAIDAARSAVVGDPLDEATVVGPLVNGAQRARVLKFIELGKSEGARVVVGGEPETFAKGYFVTPTVFSDVTNDMTIAREEIFGPVLSVLSYDDEDEALHIANDSDYGLGGAVWSSDVMRAEAFARRMQTGQVSINGGGFNAAAPFGGFKQSGVGRELGEIGLEEFLQPQSLQF